MALAEKHESLLIEIHDAEGERLPKSEILRKEQAEARETHPSLHWGSDRPL